MKIKKRTIVLFAVAALFMVGALYETESDAPGWKDATYVKDAVVLPENEGKIVAISGIPEPMGDVEDPLVGVRFPSTAVSRKVQQFQWKDSDEKWELKYVHGQTIDDFEDASIMGSVKIGDFVIAPELMQTMSVTNRDVKESDFSAEDIAHMNANGHLIREDLGCYYSTGPANYQNLNKQDYIMHPEWDGAYLISWKMRAPQPNEAATLVGVQKGNTLIYCRLNTSSANDKLMDEAAFYEEAITEVNTKPIMIVLALICAGAGVWTIVKGKKKKE